MGGVDAGRELRSETTFSRDGLSGGGIDAFDVGGFDIRVAVS